jgi:exopolysaccharide production protein ExoQ
MARMTYSQSRPRRPSGPPAQRQPLPKTQGTDKAKGGKLATLIYWLLIVRLIIPGSFDYAPDMDILVLAQRDAVFNKVTWITFLLVPTFIVAAKSGLVTRILRTTNPYFIALTAFATLSVVWSIDSVASSSRIIHVLTILLGCLAVTVSGWNPHKLQQITRPVLTVLLLGSLLFGIYSPDLAITPPTPPDIKGYWHGLTSQKNQLGSLASIGALLWFHGWASRQVGVFLAMAGFALSMTLLILSRSSTSIMATVLVSMLMLMMLRSLPVYLRRYTPYMVGLFVIVTLAYSMAVLNVVPGLSILLKPITFITGKDTTFSARTQIWDIIRTHIQLSPIIGSGYGGYWGAGPVPSSPSFIFLGVMGFYPSEAHNGYMDIINDLGYIGLLLLLGYLIYYIRQSIKLLRIDYTQATLYLGLMFQQLLTNLSESHWFVLSHDFVIMSLATFGLARSLLDATPARPRRQI